VASKIGRVGRGGEKKITVRDGERKSGVRSRLEILSGLSFLWLGRKVNRRFAISRPPRRTGHGGQGFWRLEASSRLERSEKARRKIAIRSRLENCIGMILWDLERILIADSRLGVLWSMIFDLQVGGLSERGKSAEMGMARDGGGLVAL